MMARIGSRIVSDTSLHRAGIGIAAVADTQLHEFMTVNEHRQAAGKPPVLLLDTGVN